jgi:hypothetical protein
MLLPMSQNIANTQGKSVQESAEVQRCAAVRRSPQSGTASLTTAKNAPLTPWAGCSGF